MRAMVLNDGETYTGVAGCRILDIPDALEADEVDQMVVALAKHDDREEVEEILGEAGLEDCKAQIMHIFTGSEDGIEPPLTRNERALLVEGLNYLEEHGAPGMGWRGGTKKIENATDSISKKLGLR